MVLFCALSINFQKVSEIRTHFKISFIKKLYQNVVFNIRCFKELDYYSNLKIYEPALGLQNKGSFLNWPGHQNLKKMFLTDRSNQGENVNGPVVKIKTIIIIGLQTRYSKFRRIKLSLRNFMKKHTYQSLLMTKRNFKT